MYGVGLCESNKRFQGVMESVAPIKKTVVVLLYAGCTYHEVSCAVSVLCEEREVVFAGLDTKRVQTTEGLELNPVVSVHTIDPRTCQAVLIPGGDCEIAVKSAALGAWLRRAAPDVLLAGICNGALVLASAGVLRGRSCTHTCTTKYADPEIFAALLRESAPLFATSRYVDEDVVRDGEASWSNCVITAKPWADMAFAVAIAKELGVLDEASAQRWIERTRRALAVFG